MRSSKPGFLAILLLTSLIAPMLAVPLSAPSVSAYSGIDVQFQHPSFAGLNETVPCVLTIKGGPASDLGGNFSYIIEILGTNTTGSSATPSQSTGPGNEFAVNLTMPEVAPQTLTIRINATSTGNNGASEKVQIDFRIEVVVPILIKATVFNAGEANAVNVTARFYADGELLATQTFDILGGQTKTLFYNWTFLKIKTGKHVVSVTVDEPNNIVEFSDGNNAISRTIYVGSQGNPMGAVLTGAVVFLAVLVFLIYIQKPIRRRKPNM